MNYTFIPTTLENLRPQFTAYLKSLTNPVDDFWEDHVCRAAVYAVQRESTIVGFFGVLQENSPRLTSFWLDETVSTRNSEMLFERVLGEFGIKHAYVATCDEFFLALCMTFQTEVEIQAYFFSTDNTAGVRPAEFGPECIRRVAVDELEEVHALSDRFFGEDFTEADICSGAVELYRVVENGETLGFGIMIPDKLQPHLLPCGEYVIEKHRGRGVARSMQLFFHARCAELGGRHIGGCSFHNKPSRNTFDSMGLYSRTRLLNITF